MNKSGDRRPHVSCENVEVVSPNALGSDNVLILGPDMYEENEYQQAVSILGTADVINLQNLAVFPNVDEHPGVPADQDWFAVKAQNTGTLDIAISLRTFDPDLSPAGGQVGIELVDGAGTVIAGAGTPGSIVKTGFGAYDGDADARGRAQGSRTAFLLPRLRPGTRGGGSMALIVALPTVATSVFGRVQVLGVHSVSGDNYFSP